MSTTTDTLGPAEEARRHQGAILAGEPFQHLGHTYRVKVEPDDDPDWSHLGEFSDTREGKWAINLTERGLRDWATDYEWFNPSFGCASDPDAEGDSYVADHGWTPERVFDSVADDVRTIQDGAVGVILERQCSCCGNWTHAESLWGIEGADDDYLAEIVNDLLPGD